MRKKYNTPHRSRVVKTRLSEDEYADFTARLACYSMLTWATPEERSLLLGELPRVAVVHVVEAELPETSKF